MTRAISEDKRTFDIRQEFSRAPGEAKNQRASPTRPKGKAGKGKEKERGGKRAENGKGALNSKSYKKGKKKRKEHGPVISSDEGKGKAWESDQKRRNTHGNTSRKHTWKHTPAKATATATTPCTTHHHQLAAQRQVHGASISTPTVRYGSAATLAWVVAHTPSLSAPQAGFLITSCADHFSFLLALLLSALLFAATCLLPSRRATRNGRRAV
jgi:hypothetical protein